ncbi:FprA family A-type flavoprotein [Breznakiella homolactica]|uniref:FprA family A-type flavoprotein n=1 Tax=Breznakiella homolactica TaxID=2798577 RepID=A0A7T7XQT0_9SPIR|nr:FprA family A-type flavoprotein [Breznakiella homolactica]QQO10782.1 FprA family A-type flavoprotein [Breznakiella homolactica]
MKAYAISDSVYCLHADVRTNDRFEGIWPIPDGVSLNSYLIRGEKIALVDLIRDWTDAPRQLEEELASIGVKFSDVDYLILNHLEPDHTGWLREFRELSPKAEIIATAKGIKLIEPFYKITQGLREVKDGETLDLGKGMVLQFFETPNVHWPETMMTWEAKSGTLFSCDAFGSFGALGDKVFDDQFSAEEHAFFEKETLRYYANIVSSFSMFVEKAVQKLAGLEIKCIAPSHGMVWRTNPKKIIDLYVTYAGYAKGPGEKEIAVIWGSMYGNTKAGVDAVIKGIEAEGVPCSIRRVPDDDVSYVLADAYKSAGLVLAMPTYEYAMFPPMAYAIDILRRKHVFGKQVLRIGSWGWVGGAKKEYEAAIEPLKWNSLESLEWAGHPGDDSLAALTEKGRELARIVKAL